jgi:hypothetical protein
METRNIKITLDKAKEWYNSGNTILKKVALQAFSKDELEFNFKNITSFEKACNALNLNYDIISIIVKDVATYSRASAAMFKLNIIRKALNLGQDLYLTSNQEEYSICCPDNPFIHENSLYYRDEIVSGKIEVIGKIKSEKGVYDVLNKSSYQSSCAGLGSFNGNVGKSYADVGFLGCATKEIANHFGKYFGMLIIEAMYGDLLDFKVIERKYN